MNIFNLNIYSYNEIFEIIKFSKNNPFFLYRNGAIIVFN
jgi:hypothetical protein